VAGEDRTSVGGTEFFVDAHVGVDRTRLVLTGELDLATAPAFSAALAAALRPWPGLVVLDLERLDFVDIRGVKLIAAARTRMSGWGGTLQVHRPQGAVRRVFELCELGDVLIPRPASVGGPHRQGLDRLFSDGTGALAAAVE
jgi:anti-sigma B factor antagonist